MAGARRIAAALALVAGLAVAGLSTGGASAQSRSPQICILGCTTTTTAVSTPTSTTPTLGAVTVSHLMPTSASFDGQIATAGQQVPFEFGIEQTPGEPGPTSAGPFYADPGTAPASVSYHATDLVPNSTYYVQLVSNAYSTAGPVTKFRTPIKPAAVVRFTAATTAPYIGLLNLSFGTTAASAGALYILQCSVAPYRTWKTFVDPLGTLPTGGFPEAGGRVSLSVVVVRNERLRLWLPGTESTLRGHQIQRPSTSRVVSLTVYPRTGINVTRPNNGVSLDATFTATVHPLPRGWVGERVYFYRGVHQKGTFTLLGSAALHKRGLVVQDQQFVTASVEFSDPGSATVVSCARHQIVPDMGRPFTAADCGRHSITVG